MPPKVGITWGAEADRKILLAILSDPKASQSISWDALAAELSTEAATCTVAALKKHISRLRVASKVEKDTDDSLDNPTPKTPAPKGKGKANGAGGSSAAPKSNDKVRTKRKAADDSDEDEGTPLTQKFQKIAADQEQTDIKSEVKDEEA